MKLWSGIITNKVEASKKFYVDTFACEIVYEGDDNWFILLKLGESELGFMQPELDSQAPIFRHPYSGSGMWITIETADVNAEYQRIKSLGIPIEEEIKEEVWGDRHFVIIDPNGIGVDIVQHN